MSPLQMKTSWWTNLDSKENCEICYCAMCPTLLYYRFILVIVIIVKTAANNSHSGSNYRKLGFDLSFMFLERTKFEVILID